MAFNITVRIDFSRITSAQLWRRFCDPHRRWFHDRLVVDLLLYALSAGFAVLTGLSSTLPAHRPWGRIAAAGYGVATLFVAVQLLASRTRRGADQSVLGRLTSTATRAWLTGFTWVATALVPLVYEAVARSGGRTDRAQEEVLVVEAAGRRLLDTGSPYLSRSAIAALPPADQLLGYTPYQPGMALLGVPRAAAPGLWTTDARVVFALVTAVTVGAAAGLARRWGAPGPAVLRMVQAVAVLPICTLTAATGGDDLPVLGLCLLGLTLAARQHWVGAGVAAGIAGAMKLFAWPVAAVLIVLAAVGATRRVRAAAAVAWPAVCLPLLALVPAGLVDRDAAVENVVRFPTGHGLVRTPAQSPLLGQLITQAVPGGRSVALGLLVVAALAIAGWLLSHPPRDAGAASAVCAVGLTAAIGLAPATRFGYLLYPAAFACAIPMLRRMAAAPASEGTP